LNRRSNMLFSRVGWSFTCWIESFTDGFRDLVSSYIIHFPVYICNW
jgi:hypothetical protein